MGLRFEDLRVDGWVRQGKHVGKISSLDRGKRDAHIYWHGNRREDSWEYAKDLELGKEPAEVVEERQKEKARRDSEENGTLHSFSDAEPASKPKNKHKPLGGSASERWKILNNFVDFSMKGLTPAQVKVWLVLYRDSKQGTAATSQRDIARRAGCGLKFVNAAIKVLEEKGLALVVRRGGYRKGSNRYRIRGLEPVD